MFYRSEIKLSQITDGTTNTYLVGEKYIRPTCYDGSSNSSDLVAFTWGDNQSAYVGFEWDNHRVAYNPRRLPRLPEDYYQPKQDTIGDENYGRFGSAHAAGMHMAMCDGSVHFISYDIDATTHRWLANRRDDNIVSPEDGQ